MKPTIEPTAKRDTTLTAKRIAIYVVSCFAAGIVLFGAVSFFLERLSAPTSSIGGPAPRPTITVTGEPATPAAPAPAGGSDRAAGCAELKSLNDDALAGIRGDNFDRRLRELAGQIADPELSQEILATSEAYRTKTFDSVIMNAPSITCGW